MEENVNFDNEVLAYLTVRKDQLIDSHKHYTGSHPEIREVLNDFLSSVLLHKPNDVFVFAKEYFHPFNPTPLKYKPLIVVGPSGVGKGTLVQVILKKYGGLFEQKISYTTRAKKSFEKSEGQYYFITKEEFMRRVERNEFVEWCNVHGNLYGTTYAELDRVKQKGKIPIIEVDVQGAIKINERAIEGNFLFIYPPSFDELRRRLGTRTETEEEFKLRIQNAIKEIEMANNSVLFTNRLVNDGLDQAIDQFYTLIEALYFQELKNLKEQQSQQHYFSALARGGLSAAISHSATNSQSPRGRAGSLGKSQNFNNLHQTQTSQVLSENVNLNNLNNQQLSSNNQQVRQTSSQGKVLIQSDPSSSKYYGADLNGQSMKKINKQLFPVESIRENNFMSQQQILNQKRLQCLMSGNDLQPLEEEISKEDDDSIIVRVDIQKPPPRSQNQNNANSARQGNNNGSRHRKKSSNKSNPYFPPQASGNPSFTNQQSSRYNQEKHPQPQNIHKQSSDSLQKLSQEMDHVAVMSNGGSTHSLLKGNSLKTCSSYVSGDFNYNSQMEEALMLDYLKLNEDENVAPKIFDPQFQQSYENTAQKLQVQMINTSSGSATVPTTQDNTLSYHNSQNTSKDQLQPQIQNLQQMQMDYNQIQKEKARMIIESLKAQQSKNGNHQHSSSQGKVEKRLIDYQKKLEEKLDQQRKQKEQLELKQLRQVPQITEKSNEILMRRSMMISQNNINSQNVTQSIINHNFSPRSESLSPGKGHLQQPQGNNMFALPLDKSGYQTQQILFQNYQIEQRAYFEELKRKEDLNKKICEDREMIGFTGKPQINKKSQMIKRKVNDLIQWKDLQDKKRQDQLDKKSQQEIEEVQQMQSQKVVNKNSERIIETRFKGQRATEKVEDRLIRDASLRKKKQEKVSQQKQIFYISDLHGKKSKNQSEGQRARSRSQNQRNSDLQKSRNYSPRNLSQRQTVQEKEVNKPLEVQQQFRYDQRIFSQSVDCPNNYYGQSSPAQSNNYMAGQNSNSLQSPFQQSNYSQFSTNLNNFQNSNLINPQSDFSQLHTQPPVGTNNIYPYQLPYQQPFNHNGGGSFDQNQFQFNNPTINTFSPQRLYSQHVQNQFQKQGVPGMIIPNQQQMQLQFGGNSLSYPQQQVSYINNSQNQQSLMMNSQLMQNQNNVSQKIQMTSQLQDLSILTPGQGSFLVQNQLQNNLAQNQVEKSQGAQTLNQLVSEIHAPVNQQSQGNKTKNDKKLNQQQQQKKPTGYVSLFDKVQRMNISQNSDQESCNSQQSLPIVSAQMPQIYNQTLSPTHAPIQNIKQRDQHCEYPQNSIYQQIQLDSHKLREFGINNNNFAQNSIQTHNSQHNLSTINFVDPSSLMTYPTQEILYQTIQAPIPENIHNQLQLFSQLNYQNQDPQYQYFNSNGQNQFLIANPQTFSNFQQQVNPINTQDQIIHKILENSFIPSGNVNQTRRTSSRGGTQENEGTLGYSQTLQWQQQLSQRPDQANEDLHDVFAESAENYYHQEYIQNQNRENLQSQAQNCNNFDQNNMLTFTHKTKYTNDNGQILDTDFLITNTSRGSDQFVVRNLNQVLSQDVQQSRDVQSSNRSHSETRGQFHSKKNSVSPSKNLDLQSMNNLRNLSFMDRNSQWLENKKYRLEKAKKELQIQEERQCPFKPQIHVQILNADKPSNGLLNSGSQTQRSKSNTRGSSLSLERARNSQSQSRDLSKGRVSVDRDIQVYPIQEGEMRTFDNSVQKMGSVMNDDMSNQASIIKKSNNNHDEMSTSMKQQELLNSNTTDKRLNSSVQTYKLANPGQNHPSNLDRRHNNLLINDDGFNVSGQCDITNLSPDAQNRGAGIDDSNFDTSFLSLHFDEKKQYSSAIPQNLAEYKGAGQVKVMCKKQINF